MNCDILKRGDMLVRTNVYDQTLYRSGTLITIMDIDVDNKKYIVNDNGYETAYGFDFVHKCIAIEQYVLLKLQP